LSRKLSRPLGGGTARGLGGKLHDLLTLLLLSATKILEQGLTVAFE
jgi:hypothetical protein